MNPPSKKLPGRFEALVRLMPPQALMDDVRYKSAVEMIDRLMAIPKLTRGQELYLETLVQLVQAYEARHHRISTTDLRSSHPARMTPRQGQFLAFIHAYTQLHGVPPAELDMAMYFRVSPPSVHGMVKTLERRGFIQRTPGTPRSIRLLVPREQLPDLE